MAIPATQVWEVRPTNGTANAGGGFDPALIAGSDFSQQNAVQVAFDGAVIFATTGGADSTITITGYTPLLNDVGNALAITAGTNFTTGIYSIRTSNPGAASWTLDRTCTSGAGAAMTGNMGGARVGLHKGSPVSSLSSALVAGNTTWIKNEAWNEAVVLGTSGAGGSPITFIGYNAARGDITVGSGNANNPVNNRASAVGDGITYAGLTNIEFRNINVTAAGDAGFSGVSGANVRLINCRSFLNTNEGIETTTAHTITAEACEFDANGTVGIGAAVANNFNLIANYIHDNGAAGIQSSGAASNMLTLNIFDSNGGNSITGTTATALLLTNNTFWNTTGANTDHVNMTTPSNGLMTNNIFANAARFGVNMTDGDSVFGDYNCYSGNVGGAHANFSSGAHDSTTNPLFTLASNGDFSLGATLSGFPGVFPSGKSTGFLSMGAVQPQGGASSTIINICNSVVL